MFLIPGFIFIFYFLGLIRILYIIPLFMTIVYCFEIDKVEYGNLESPVTY